MTDVKDVLMFSIESKMDYETLKMAREAGRGRIPVYEDVVEHGVSQSASPSRAILSPAAGVEATANSKSGHVKRVVGILLLSDCVLLDPKGSCVLRS
jgi:hypothetical protein